MSCRTVVVHSLVQLLHHQSPIDMSIPRAEVGSLLLEGICRHALKDPANTVEAVGCLKLVVLNETPLKSYCKGR